MPAPARLCGRAETRRAGLALLGAGPAARPGEHVRGRALAVLREWLRPGEREGLS